MFRVTFFLIFLLFQTDAAFGDQFEVIRSGRDTLRFNSDLGGAALEVSKALPSLKARLQDSLRLSFDFSVEIVLYKHHERFSGLVKNDMVQAFAVPERKIVVIDYSRIKIHPFQLEQILLHELSHLLLHHHIEKDRLPKWFNEGISQWVSGGTYDIIVTDTADVLKRAFLSQSLLPFHEIEDTFPGGSRDLILAYEQSRSFIEFLDARYGTDKIGDIILYMKEGNAVSEAMRKSLSIDLAALEREWLGVLKMKYTWLYYVTHNISWILLTFGALLTVCGFIQIRRKMMRNDDEDGESVMEDF